MAPTIEDLPRYRDPMLPVLRAVDQLRGSATRREIVDSAIVTAGLSEEAGALETSRPHEWHTMQ